MDCILATVPTGGTFWDWVGFLMAQSQNLWDLGFLT